MRDRNNNIAQHLTVLAAKRYTGILRVKSPNCQEWIIYLRLGRIVWIDGGYHPNRSWQRHLAKYCPQVDISEIINITSSGKSEDYRYESLLILFESQLIARAEIKAIIASIIVENLFEIIQEENNRKIYYVLESDLNSRLLSSVLNIAFTLVDVNKILKQVGANWQLWQRKGLANWQPNLSPKIKNKAKLKEEVSENIYRNLVKLIDGNKTLRDLACQMNRDIIEVAISLVNYIEGGTIELIEVDDLRKEWFKKSKRDQEPNNNKRLIVAIDDSKVVAYIMNQIVERAGHKLITIDQPLRAIPTLIGVKPDLIFLDLAMPIVNGYDICRQIRRISQFKNVPIIILTSSKGFIEKAKTKTVGATEFLSKPIEEEIILKTIDKYLISNRQRVAC